MKSITKILDAHSWLSYIIISVLASLDALVSVVFIYPNGFAPVGIQGFTTMIQYLLGISVGYIYILINAPMLVIAFFFLNKKYALKNLCYIASFSVMTVVIQGLISSFDISHLEYRAQSTESLLIVAIGYGAFMGLTYTAAVSLGGSTGGTDILAALINRFKPTFNAVWVIFSINAGVAVMSYFVYGRATLPVLLSVSCAFVTGYISDYLLRGASSALKFEIVTDRPDELAADIMNGLARGCTRISATGMYSRTENAVLMCVVNKRQRFEMERLIAKYEGSFGICTSVRSTYGDFRRRK